MTKLKATRFRACYVCSERAWPGTGYERLVTELEIGHDLLAHRTYNRLLCHGLSSVHQLAGLTDMELLRMPGFGERMLRRLRTKVDRPGPQRRASETEQAASLRLAARWLAEEHQGALYEVVAALGTALREAADEFDYCARVNAKHGTDVPDEIPTPTAEALAAAAAAYLDYQAGSAKRQPALAPA